MDDLRGGVAGCFSFLRGCRVSPSEPSGPPSGGVVFSELLDGELSVSMRSLSLSPSSCMAFWFNRLRVGGCKVKDEAKGL